MNANLELNSESMCHFAVRNKILRTESDCIALNRE